MQDERPIHRADACSDALRNRYILDHADKLFLGARDPDGSLTDLFPLPSHLYKCEGSPTFHVRLDGELFSLRNAA